MGRLPKSNQHVVFTFAEIPDIALKEFDQRRKIKVLIDPDRPDERYFIDLEFLKAEIKT